MAKLEFFGESRILDSEARAHAPGKFVTLPDGMVHYEMVGPPGGQIVVLVHGFSIPYYIWDPTFGALAEAGFRVLRYDLYGRGYSDRPDTVYGPDLFDRQCLGLLSALDVGGPVDLVGLSMGGAIAVVFTDRHPEMVRKLGLIDPAGFPSSYPLAAKLLQAPLVGELIMGLLGDRILLSGLADDFHRSEKLAAYIKKYRPQMQYRGFKRALLSTWRGGILGDLTETYRRVGNQRRPVLLIWGREDRVIPFRTSKKVQAAIPHVEFHTIEEAGHVPHYERPKVVNPLLVEFLSG